LLPQLGPALIGLLGGYSAEAVNRILRRLVAMIIALFEGETTHIIRARLQEMKAQSAAQDAKRRLSNVAELTGIYHQINSGVSEEAAKKLKALLEKMIDSCGEESSKDAQLPECSIK